MLKRSQMRDGRGARASTGRLRDEDFIDNSRLLDAVNAHSTSTTTENDLLYRVRPQYPDNPHEHTKEAQRLLDTRRTAHTDRVVRTRPSSWVRTYTSLSPRCRRSRTATCADVARSEHQTDASCAAPKKKQEKMNLGEFLTNQSLGSWADEMDSQPIPSAPSGYGRDRDMGEKRSFTQPAWGEARSGSGMGGGMGDRGASYGKSPATRSRCMSFVSELT